MPGNQNSDVSQAPRKEKFSLGTRIVIGVLAGIALGVFLGDLTGPLAVVGSVYVNLLQMTVLPYVVISLVTNIGRLSFGEAKKLGGRAGLVMIALWGISLLVVGILPLSLPHWEAGTYFSSSLVEEPEELDLLALYVPTNPFHSLANNVVPAVVIFSLLIGVALIGIEKKNQLIEPLSIAGEALGGIAKFITRLAPYGTFALAAGAAGTLSPGELFRIAGYVASYTFGVLLLTFIVLPAFVALLTPYSFIRVVSGARSALLTAFATGKLFVVLPMVISTARDLIVEKGADEHEAQESAEMLVSLAYPFPNAGKLLAIFFVLFAAWYVGDPLELADLPMLFSVGLLAFFGNPVAAIPFLLGIMRLPGDLLSLFLIAGIWCARIGDVVGAMHLAAFTLVCDAWNRGWMRLRAARVVPVTVVVVVGGSVLLGANYLLVSESIRTIPRTKDRVLAMELVDDIVEMPEIDARPNPAQLRNGENRLQRILRTGVLRVGYEPNNPPFCYSNASGKLVGFDVDLVQRLAFSLGVELRFVPYERAALKDSFDADHFDLAISEIMSSVRNWGEYHETESYLELNLALLVEDHRAKEFDTRAEIKSMAGVRFGAVKGMVNVRPGLFRDMQMQIVPIEDPREFLEGEETDLDAMVVSAESGAVLTMNYPRFSIVIPKGISLRVPIVFATRERGELSRLVDSWIELKRKDGTIPRLYEHWVLGKELTKTKKRWSIVRNVLGWVD